MNAREKRRIIRKVCREFEHIQTEYQRILARLHKLGVWLADPSAGGSLLRLSDEFAAIERAAARAKDGAYELYLWAGREEINRQQQADE